MKKDGGPAFPQAPDGHPDNKKPGMSLRDYFAAAALNRLLAWDFAADMEKFPKYSTNAAQTAYAMADAMLAERDK